MNITVEQALDRLAEYHIKSEDGLGLLAIIRQTLTAPRVPDGETHTFWIVYDATTDKKYIKKNADSGALAMFDYEHEARAVSLAHPGTGYKQVTYIKTDAAPAPADPFTHSAELHASRRNGLPTPVHDDDDGRVLQVNSAMPLFTTMEGEEIKRLRERVKELERYNIGLANESHELRELVPEGWHKGCPPKPYGSEWFIAKLDNGGKVVLRELPEESSYDYTTRDETYFKAFRIKEWMQFPDSGFIPHSPAQSADSDDAVRILSLQLTERDAEIARLRERVKVLEQSLEAARGWLQAGLSAINMSRLRGGSDE